MKSSQGLLELLLLVSVLVRFSDAASLRGPEQVSLLSKDEEMPITKHDKAAGGDYNKGSPLFKKQQDRKAAVKAKGGKEVKIEQPHAKADLKDGVSVKTPSQEEVLYPSTWWAMYGGFNNHVEKGFASFISYFIFVMLMALIWMKCAGGRKTRGYRERPLNDQRFAYGLFSMDHMFVHHSGVCFMSFCCAPLRLADTYAKQPFPAIASFWGALILVTTLLGLQQLTLGVSYVMFLVMAIYFRTQFRKQYDLPTGATPCCFDCMTWFFCPCFAIAQEARQVEFVVKPRDPNPPPLIK